MTLTVGKAMAAIRARLAKGRAGYSELKGAVRLAAGTQRLTEDQIRDITQDARDALVRNGEVTILTVKNLSGSQSTFHALTAKATA